MRKALLLLPTALALLLSSWLGPSGPLTVGRVKEVLAAIVLANVLAFLLYLIGMVGGVASRVGPR